MLIISQNKEKVMRFGISFNALKYAERTDRKGKQTIVRHTITFISYDEEYSMY